MHAKPMGFEVKRLSLDESRLDIPMDGVPINWYSKNNQPLN
jgi:hypothetical protein